MIRCLMPVLAMVAAICVLAACAGGQSGAAPEAAPRATGLSFPYLSPAEAEVPNYGQWARRVAPGYVRVTLVAPGAGPYGDSGGPIHTGSGMVVDPRGYIVTVAHIARDPSFRARVTTLDGASYDGRILDVVPLAELALIKIEPRAPLDAVTFADSDRIHSGDPVVALGSQTSTREFGLASLGWVKVPKYDKPLRYNDWGFDDAIWLSMKVDLGFSGGPVFDRDGRVVAMVAGAELGAPGRDPSTPVPRIAYAVPSNAVAAYVRRNLGGTGGG